MTHNEDSNKSIFTWTCDWANMNTSIFLHSLSQIHSTNSFAKDIPKCPTPQVVIADKQTHGRGRGTHQWTSPQGESALLSSWIFDLDFLPQPILSPLIGLALYKAIYKIEQNPSISIKAPNDIYYNSLKLAGILIELQSQGKNTRCIIGIGLNVFDSPVEHNATALFKARKTSLEKEEWFCFLDQLYSNLKDSIYYSANSHLTLDQRKELLMALNKHPNYFYSELLENGSLVENDKIIPWNSL